MATKTFQTIYITLVFNLFSITSYSQETVVSNEENRRLYLYDWFIDEYRPDYALFNRTLHGIVRKDQEWSLVWVVWEPRKNTIDTQGKTKPPRRMSYVHYPLSQDDAMALLAAAAADSTFAITQTQLDSLPRACLPDPNNRRSGMDGPSIHARYTEIIQYKNGHTDRRKHLGADEFYRYCYPSNEEYKILAPLLHTENVLSDSFREKATTIQIDNYPTPMIK